MTYIGAAYDVLDVIEKASSIGACIVTLVFGVVAYVKRDKIALIFRYLKFSYVSERSKRLKETLGKLEALHYDDKTSRSEIFALMGQISGQLKALEQEHNDFGTIQSEIKEILEKKRKLSEATKRQILYSIHSALDALSLNNINHLPKPSQ